MAGLEQDPHFISVFSANLHFAEKQLYFRNLSEELQSVLFSVNFQMVLTRANYFLTCELLGKKGTIKFHENFFGFSSRNDASQFY